MGNTGILAFLNRYNFTISEDTPLELDVAVDPEMLGKVFENQLEAQDRGQSGSFYTPRVIVAYMCQEALAGYLATRAAVPRERAQALFYVESSVLPPTLNSSSTRREGLEAPPQPAPAPFPSPTPLPSCWAEGGTVLVRG